MQKKVTVLGSSGSIGKSALDVIRHSPEFKIYGLSVNSSIQLLGEQIAEFAPAAVAVADERAAEEFVRGCVGKYGNTEFFAGNEGARQLAGADGADIVLVGVVGNAGIAPTLAAANAGKTIALANKEALVSAGELITRSAAENGAEIIPVDSEHSAVFQCLRGNHGDIKRIILTASGGAFRGMKRTEFENAKAADALKHPTWQMGAKITIDSATLMNKGLEVMEAHWLFGVPLSKIDIIIHPQSIIHSMVEFADGQILAQLGVPDMRFPIQYALTYPERRENPFPKLDFSKLGALTFEKPDYEAFPCVKLAYRAMEMGGTEPCVLNEANQELVRLYLEGKIGFYDISETIEEALNAHKPVYNYTLSDLDAAREWAREFVYNKWSFCSNKSS